MRAAWSWLWFVGLPLVAPLGCDKATAASTSAATEIAQAVAPLTHVDAGNYKVDTRVGDCTAGAECSASVRLEALGAYHINDNYPYKLTVFGPDAGSASSSGLELLGKDPANKSVFGKATGDFEKKAEKVAVLTVRFKAPAGKVLFAGHFKMSVCSEANCQLDQADLRFEGIAK